MDREHMQEVINGMRKIVKPYLAKQLKKINFEGCGNTDKAEFETDFEIVLTLAEQALARPSAEPTKDLLIQIIRDILAMYVVDENGNQLSRDEVKCGAINIVKKYLKQLPSAEPKTVKSCDTCKHDEAFGCPSFIHDRCENYSEWEQADKSKCKALEQEPKWIPVSKRLPEDSYAVLVWCPERKNIYCAYREENQWWIFGSYFEKVRLDVIAWMPLPKPYEPQESENKE